MGVRACKLARHSGAGAFVPGESDEPADDFAEVEATAYIEAFYTSGPHGSTARRALPTSMGHEAFRSPLEDALRRWCWIADSIGAARAC